MQRVNEILKQIRFIEDSYDVSLSGNKQKAACIYKTLGEVLKSKTFLDEKDFEVMSGFDFSRYEELGILRQPYMTLEEMREKADLLGFVIIPISFSGYQPENKKIEKIAESLGLNTYVMTSLENYDVWKEVIASNNVGGKYFPDEYASVHLSIELMLGTQKNLYRMIMGNRAEIERLANSLNESMRNVQKIFRKISQNQQKLKKQSDYLLERVIYLYKNEITGRIDDNINLGNHMRYKIQRRRYNYLVDKWFERMKEKYLRGVSYNEYDWNSFPPPPKEIVVDDCEELNLIYDAVIPGLRRQYEKFENSINRLKLETRIEDIQFSKFEKFELFHRFQVITKMKQVVECKGAVIFHTSAFEISEDDAMVFLNETLNIEEGP